MSSPRTRAHVALGTALLLACLRTACCAPRAEITGGRAVLDNGVCHVEFDAATGGIASLTPGPESLRGQWFEVIEEDRAGLEPWETWRQGPVSAFAGGPAQVSAENGGGIATVRLTYDRPSGLRIEAEVRLADADPGPLCRLTVRNLTGAVLVDTIRLPVIRGVELGDPQDDWFTWPHTLGARFRANGPAPERLQPATPGKPPSGPFLLLGQRCTGQGITLPFIQGIPEGDHRRTDVAAGGEQAFIYFAVADAYVFDTRESVEVEVEYLDEGTAPFELHYDSWDENAPVKGAFKAAPPCPRTDTQDWRTHTFVLDDARLANREHQGADFRLHARGTDLRVRRVAVRAPGRCESGIVIGPFSVYQATMHGRRALPGFSVPVSGLDDQVLLGEPDQAHSLQSMEPSPER
ncbi:MAG: hypothetical protein QM473_20755 [Acidobacteriota bacterium]|nr:hypothetical protein [Acidobacteriota bacterium]